MRGYFGASGEIPRQRDSPHLGVAERVVEDLGELGARVAARLGVDEHDQGRLGQLRRQELLRVGQVRRGYPAGVCVPSSSVASTR